VAQSGGPTDVIDSSAYGVIQEAKKSAKMAVRYELQGLNGKMVTLVREEGPKYKCTTGLAELRDVANGEKKVPREFINDRGNHVTKAMRDYLRPLVQGEAPIKIGDDACLYLCVSNENYWRKNCQNICRT